MEEKLPESDVEEAESNSQELDKNSRMVAACILSNLNEMNSNKTKVLRCYRCNKVLLFQNELDLENIKANNIACEDCRKKRNKLTKSR